MSDLPPEIAARWVWPSAERVAEMEAQRLIPRMPQGWRSDGNRYADWTADPVTIRAVALLPDRMLERLEAWLKPSTDFDSRLEQEAPPCAHDAHVHMGLDTPASIMPLWTGVVSIAIITWADTRVICDVRIHSDGALRYADRALDMGGDVPDQVRAAAAGSPMEHMLPHPLFANLAWGDEQDGASLLRGPETRVRLGARPGHRLVELAMEQRGAMLADAVSRGWGAA